MVLGRYANAVGFGHMGMCKVLVGLESLTELGGCTRGRLGCESGWRCPPLR